MDKFVRFLTSRSRVNQSYNCLSLLTCKYFSVIKFPDSFRSEPSNMYTILQTRMKIADFSIALTWIVDVQASIMSSWVVLRETTGFIKNSEANNFAISILFGYFIPLDQHAPVCHYLVILNVRSLPGNYQSLQRCKL